MVDRTSGLYANDGSYRVTLTDGDGVAVSAGAGVQYTEGDTDATIEGTAVLAEGPANALTPLQVDASGNLQVDVVGSLPAGTNNIGDVDIASIAAGDNNIGNVDVVTLPALPAGTNNIGDVDVLTLPAIPAGTNLIGKVDHPTTGFGNGVKTVSAAGTDEALAGSTTAKWVVVQAQTDNTSVIAVGATGVDATVATGTGVILYPGDILVLPCDNLADVFIDALVSGEGVRFTYGT